MENGLLFQPHRLVSMVMPNRMVMAPPRPGRSRRTPNDMMALYYRQRAEAG